MRIHVSRDDLVPYRPTRPAGPKTPTLVTSTTPGAPSRYRLLAGPEPGAEPALAWCLNDPAVVEALDAFCSSAKPLSRVEKMQLACLLAPHLRAPQLAALLDHRDPAEVWRWGALGRAHPKLREAVLRGQLTMTHARPLLTMPHADQAAWVSRALRGRWSVRQLTAAVRRGDGDAAPSNADIRALEGTIGDRLGASVRVLWPDDPNGQRRLVIDWYDVESLKGILAQLASGPEQLDEPLQAHARQLVIPLQTAGELAALTQHLMDA